MTEPKKRRWFQLHLSTCIVMMLLLAGFLWLNLGLKHRIASREDDVARKRTTRTDADGFGFPFVMHVKGTYSENYFDGEFVGYSTVIDAPLNQWYPVEIILNIAVMIAVIGACTLTCEYLLRRREARKPRRWFQLHLSTCIVMMLAASTLVYFNLVPRIIRPANIPGIITWSGPPEGYARTYSDREVWGWPFNYRIYYEPDRRESVEKARRALQELPQDAPVLEKVLLKYDAEEYEDWFMPAIAYNALAALAILAATALLCEFFLRRREAPRS